MSVSHSVFFSINKLTVAKIVCDISLKHAAEKTQEVDTFEDEGGTISGDGRLGKSIDFHLFSVW